MSYEKKMKDLLARLVSMSPEPPPYPEGTPMARHQESRRSRPALVFVGAAVLVIALAVPLLLFTGGGEPDVIATTTTTTVPVTSTTSGVTTTTAPETTSTTSQPTTTVPGATSWMGTVFLYQSPESSFLGNPALVPVSVELTDLTGQLLADDPFTEALSVLGPEVPELDDNASLSNAVPPAVQIADLGVTTVDGTEVWAADMNEEFLAGAGGLLADITMLNQLVYTITWGEGTDAGVLFTVDGQPVPAFGSEGLDLSAPVYRDSYLEDLAPIFLTEPLIQLGDTYQVSGLANVFEASLTVQVVDQAGEVVHEEPVMATCGSGCWGTFTVEIDPGLVTPGESSIRLLTYSAEDGSPIDVITVPIPAGDVWLVTVGD